VTEVARLAERIRRELDDLERVLQRVEEGWKLAVRNNDDYYADSVALNLHGLYNGLERLFELIAALVDGVKPDGEYWHQLLLQQMGDEMSGIRPAIISEDTRAKLDELRGFRHVVRNVYTFKFDPHKIEALVKLSPVAMKQAREELMAFAEFLDQAALTE
jgi:hypothetical protein